MRSPRRPARRTSGRTSRLTRAAHLGRLVPLRRDRLRHDRAADRPGDRSPDRPADPAARLDDEVPGQRERDLRARGHDRAQGAARRPCRRRRVRSGDGWLPNADPRARLASRRLRRHPQARCGPDDEQGRPRVLPTRHSQPRPMDGSGSPGSTGVLEGTRIVARRSNQAGTSFGAAVAAAPPGGLLTGAVDLSAQSDRARRRRPSAGDVGHVEDGAHPAAAWTDPAPGRVDAATVTPPS